MIEKPEQFIPFIFNTSDADFDECCLQIFKFQLNNNNIYYKYCQQFKPEAFSIASADEIPFLPVSFFKTHNVVSTDKKPEQIFTSSGTTGITTARHLVPYISIYQQSFLKTFRLFYGEPTEYAFFCLLPEYLERPGSSLIYMAQHLMEASGQEQGGFFLDAGNKMISQLQKREVEGKKSFLLGVSFALLDFAEKQPLPLKNTIIMETGGMKGRRREMTRMELHETLQNAFSVDVIHSEYGMTELLSQGYSKGNGLYRCPPWMQVRVRAEDDPRKISRQGAGLLCIIDLANVYSCSFIETADVGKVYPDGRFEVLGRMDNSDIRGCSLLVV